MSIKSQDFSSIPRQYNTNSPSGGPDKHKKAAVVLFYLKSETISYLTGSSIESCNVKMPSEKDDTKYGGPTPVNEYLIGLRYEHSEHKIDWYKLYPRKEDNSGYYPYLEKNKEGRNTFGLHPGTVSLGCATVNAPSYDEDDCWKKLRTYIDSGTLTYKNTDFSGFLYVVDK